MATKKEVTDFIKSNYVIEGEQKNDGDSLLIVRIEGVTNARRQTIFIGVE